MELKALLRGELWLTFDILLGLLIGDLVLRWGLADRLMRRMMPWLRRHGIGPLVGLALTLSLGSAKAGAAVLASALSEGRIVLCERYSDSTLAYQVWGRGLSEAFVASLIASCGFLAPDLTVLLDIDAGTAERRLGGRGGADRIESAGSAFMARVAEGYRELARRSPERIVAVDAAGTEDEVGARIESALLNPLEERLRAG